jgi:hypothetical protein
MDPLELLLAPQTARAREQPVHGMVTARVQKIEDDGSYRLDYLTMGSGEPSAPARVMMPMAGNKTGMHFFPQPGDEVVVAFELGDTNLPIILGAVWNNQTPPPDQAKQSPDNNVRTIVSRSGHELTFDDTPGAEKMLVKTQGGHSLTLDDAPGQGKVTLQTSGGRTLTLDDTPPGGVTRASAAGVQMEFSDAGGMLTLSAPLGVTIQSGGTITLQGMAITIQGTAVTIQGTAITLLTTGVLPTSTITLDTLPVATL